MQNHTSIFFSELLILIGLLFMEDNQNGISLGQKKKKRRATNSKQNLKHFKHTKIFYSSKKAEKNRGRAMTDWTFLTFIGILKLIRNCKEEELGNLI